MKDIKVFCSWELEIDLKHDKQIELYVDTIPSTTVPEGVVRFVFLLEPPEIYNISDQALFGLKNNTYNFLLTHNQDLIDASEKAHLFEFATTWVRNYRFPKKEFSISTLVGGKLLAPGHHLRQKLWFKENRITVPKRFFLSGNFGGLENYNNNPILGSDKLPLFDSQFHICIENVKRKNWFTEKLIDCLQTKTVPIYYGCPNIGDWFDLRGFIVAESLDDIVDACNSLTDESYEKMLPFVESNFEKSKYYATIDNRLADKILEILK